IDLSAPEYTKRFKQPYHVRGGKHGQLVKDLLRTFDLPELKNRALRLWESEDPFISRTDRGIGILASQINNLVPLLQPAQPPLTNTPKGDLTYAHGCVREWRLRRLEQRKDRKSTRLNSSLQIISYAVFCLKKKNEM